MVKEQVKPFPATKWSNLQKRATAAARNSTKQYHRNRPGYRLDKDAVLCISFNLIMRGNGELVGWQSPTIAGYEPRNHDWVEELELDKEG